MSTNTTLTEAPGQLARYSNPYTLVLGLVIAAGVLIQWYTSSNVDLREPPIVYPKVPLIGHLLGIMTKQAGYLTDICAKSPSPIFTIKIFSKKIYVVTSPELVQSVFRNAKTLSFEPIFASAARKIFQFTDPDFQVLATKIDGIDNDAEYPVSRASTKAAHSTLQPGPGLYDTNAHALKRFALFFDEIGSEGQCADLYEWLSHRFTIATAEALYGPINPISEDETLIQKLLDYESSIGLLFLDILPSITCSKGHQARAAFLSAFKGYYHENHHVNSSALVRARYDIHTRVGFSKDKQASFDVGILMAATMNSSPGIFWLVSYIFADPALLSAIRQEIDATTVESGDSGKREVCINIGLIHEKCPLLVSSWQETLRLRAATVANRVVTADTLINDTYLLKKDSVIQMPFSPMHTASSTWGADAHTFNPDHFLPSATKHLSKDEKKRRKQGFTPFGGGTVLCPGRYLASSEILGVVATLVAGFEIDDVRVLGCKMQVMSAQVKQPDGDLKVKIRRREGYESVKWTYEAGGEKGGAGLVLD